METNTKKSTIAKDMHSNSDVAMETTSREIAMQCKQEAMCSDQLVDEEIEVMLDWFWQGFNAICLDMLIDDEKQVNCRLYTT